MKKEAIASVLILFVIASVSFVIAAGSSTGNSIGSFSELTFTVSPYKANCQTLVPSKCLVVNGQNFYGAINEFNYEEGYEYVIKVRRTQIYTPENVPADLPSIYEFELISIISKTPARTTCENIDILRERIKCRFQYKAVARAEASQVVEEACRGRASEQACIALYDRSAMCYELTNAVAKKRCFLEKSGININAGGTFRAAPDDTKRNYVVLLLYELQERIENMEETGTLTSDEAAGLVAQIVEIKKLIIEGKPRSEIVPKIQTFKQDYRTVVGGTAQ